MKEVRKVTKVKRVKGMRWKGNSRFYGGGSQEWGGLLFGLLAKFLLVFNLLLSTR